MKVELPADLRHELVHAEQFLAAEIEQTLAGRDRLTAERASLESEAGRLAVEIQTLTGQALRDTGAAEKLNAVTTRKGLVAGRIAQIRAALANEQPVSLASLRLPLDNLIRHYQSVLPDLFLAHNSMFFSNASEARSVVRSIPALHTLARLRSVCIGLEREPAGGATGQKILAVFRRALRGQPHLGGDFADDAAAPVPDLALANKTGGEVLPA